MSLTLFEQIVMASLGWLGYVATCFFVEKGVELLDTHSAKQVEDIDLFGGILVIGCSLGAMLYSYISLFVIDDKTGDVVVGGVLFILVLTVMTVGNIRINTKTIIGKIPLNIIVAGGFYLLLVM